MARAKQIPTKIVKDADGQYHVRRVAKNGEITLTSEGYDRPSKAERGARSAIRAILVEAGIPRPEAAAKAKEFPIERVTE